MSKVADNPGQVGPEKGLHQVIISTTRRVRKAMELMDRPRPGSLSSREMTRPVTVAAMCSVSVAPVEAWSRPRVTRASGVSKTLETCAPDFAFDLTLDSGASSSWGSPWKIIEPVCPGSRFSRRARTPLDWAAAAAASRRRYYPDWAGEG